MDAGQKYDASLLTMGLSQSVGRNMFPTLLPALLCLFHLGKQNNNISHPGSYYHGS